MVQLIFENSIKWKLIPYIQSNHIPITQIMNKEQEDKFNIKINELNDIIINDELLLQKYAEFVFENKKDMYMLCFEPYFSRIFKSLYVRKLLPSVLSDKRLTYIKTFLQCESHNEAINFMLSKLIH